MYYLLFLDISWLMVFICNVACLEPNGKYKQICVRTSLRFSISKKVELPNLLLLLKATNSIVWDSVLNHKAYLQGIGSILVDRGRPPCHITYVFIGLKFKARGVINTNYYLFPNKLSIPNALPFTLLRNYSMITNNNRKVGSYSQQISILENRDWV